MLINAVCQSTRQIRIIDRARPHIPIMIIVEMWAWFAWCAATLFHEEKKRKKKKEGKKRRRNNFKKASFLCILHRVSMEGRGTGHQGYCNANVCGRG